MNSLLLIIGCLIAVLSDEISVMAAEPQGLLQHQSLPGPLKVLSGKSRYFIDPHGNPVYLNGSHTHLSLLEAEGESKLSFKSLLDFLQEHRHNFTKLWRHEDTHFAPVPYQRVGRDVALDGKSKFDLTKLNHQYFEDLRSRAAAAQERGIYIGIMLFNGWSVEGKSPAHKVRKVWNRHPFHRHNNVNGIDGDLNGDGEGPEVYTLNDPAVTAIQEAYVREVIDTVNDLDNVLYEIINEAAATPDNTAWQYHMIDYIHEYERSKPKQHPVGMTVQWPEGSNHVLYESPADWISPNPNDGYGVNPPATDCGKVVLNDTDHLWGNGGSADWVWMSFTRGLNPIFMDLTPPLSKGYTMPQADEIRAAMGDTLEYAQRINLEKMEPRQDPCSTTFCLVNLGQEYLIYSPPTGSCSIPCQLTVDLSGAETMFEVEWFSPDTRKRQPGGTTAGGSVRTFIPPFYGMSVLYLKAQGS